MEPLGSSINLYKTKTPAELDESEEIEKLVTSCTSLTRYEGSSFKSWLPQVVSSVIAGSFQTVNGIALAFTSVIITQLAEPGSDIQTSESDNAWIASIISMVQPMASLFCALLMDSLGRLNSVRVAAFPAAAGWITIALAQNVSTIIAGRILLGIAIVCGSNPCMVYITEIASAKIRMSLLGLVTTFASLGMVIGYFGGIMMNWRNLAWASVVPVVVAFVCSFFIHESPPYLIWKGKFKRAEKSLAYLHKHQPQPSDRKESYATLLLTALKEEEARKRDSEDSRLGAKDTFRELLKPTGYKPIFVLLGLAVFQHLSGVYTTLFYSITFIQEAGTNIDGYVASVLIGFIRMLVTLCNMYLLKNYRRRTLYFVSGCGMTFFMFLTALYTDWIKEGSTDAKWVPVVAILFYVTFATLGFLFLPIMGIAELYPLKIRGIGYSISMCLNCAVMFGVLQSYYTLNHFFGGASKVQRFYAIMSMAGTVFVYIFLPETKGMKLKDISEGFNKGWVYIGHDHKRQTQPDAEKS